MSAATLRFVAIGPDGEASGVAASIADLQLSRPEAANAFSKELLAELPAHLAEVAARPGCRALVLRGQGKHFSAGADLAWMQAAARLDLAGNIRDAELLTALFEALANLPLPTVAVVQGAVYGGAVGLAAACDIVLATSSVKFCLSEVRLGLLPAVILPYLARRMQPGALRRYALSGRVFGAQEALTAGLVQRIIDDSAGPDACLREELTGLLAASPVAQGALKALLATVTTDSLRQGPHTAAAIATQRVSANGQAGLAAYFAKQPAPWALSLDPTWRLDQA